MCLDKLQAVSRFVKFVTTLLFLAILSIGLGLLTYWVWALPDINYQWRLAIAYGFGWIFFLREFFFVLLNPKYKQVKRTR